MAMSDASTKSGLVFTARSDAIRIVPVHTVDAIGVAAHSAPPAVPANLTYRGGPLLGAVEVFTLFWGQPWTVAPQSDVATKLNGFFDAILSSALIDQLGEYSVTGATIGHGRRTGSATVTSPALHRHVSDGQIQHFLQQEIATNSQVPHPNANSLYFVYLPPGVSVSQGGSRSCQAFCGYHSDINGQVFYAVMPYAGCSGCVGGMSLIDAMTTTSSHELCEAITDAVPGQGWYDDANGEIGDICAWKTKSVAGHTVQMEWSNKANACI
jgi:hypothetical protein